jgi:SAM-dependent methyltransferase
MSSRAEWERRHAARPGRAAASEFVARHVARLAAAFPGAPALDVACGAGRHTALLVTHGFRTLALDHSLAACRRVLAEIAGAAAVAGDALALPLAQGRFAIVVQTSFLERSIVSDLLSLLAPGGVLLAETFLVAQHEATGHPRREFCLEPGELAALCSASGVPVTVLDGREGPVVTPAGTQHLAAIAVRKQ